VTTPSDHADDLRNGSGALQGVLSALLEADRRASPFTSPLERLNRIMSSPDWAWLQPLYRLIADIDHALAEGVAFPASEVAAIGAHARALLSGEGAPVEQDFLDRYRVMLQSDPDIVIAHAAALQALSRLPPEPDNESERLHARHQWNERRRHLRGNPRQTSR
jgi:hypothetical protein